MLEKRIQEEEQRQNLRKDATSINNFVGNVSKSKRCQHGRRSEFCWSCNPSLHPRNSICSSCSNKGHKSEASSYCPNFSKKVANHVEFNKEKSDADAPDYWDVPKPTFKVNNVKRVHHADANDLRNKLIAQKKAKMSEDIKYVLDGGANQTILKNKDHLKNYTDCIEYFNTADSEGQLLKCIGKGDLVLPNLIIKECYYCPNVPYNLISEGQICDDGYRVNKNAKYSKGRNLSSKQNVVVLVNSMFIKSQLVKQWLSSIILPKELLDFIE